MNIKTLKKHNKANIKTVFAVFAIAVSLIFVNACSDAATERAEETGGVTAQQIIENPEAYVGKTVTVSGDVEEIYDPRAFDMDSSTSIGNLLVIGTTPFPKFPDENGRVVAKGDIATVTGVVKMLTTVEDVEREIGWDLTPEIETTYKTKPVLIAQNSSFRAGTATNDSTVMKDADNTLTTDNTAEMTDANTVDKKVVSDPNTKTEIVNFSDFEKAVDRKSFVGRRIRLEAVNVQSVVGDRAFYVGTSPGKRILIIFQEEATPNTTVEGKVDIDRGQKVSIDGVVRAMPPVEEAKRQFGKLMSAETLNGLRNEETYIYTDDPKIIQSKK